MCDRQSGRGAISLTEGSGERAFFLQIYRIKSLCDAFCKTSGAGRPDTRDFFLPDTFSIKSLPLAKCAYVRRTVSVMTLLELVAAWA